MAASTRSQLSIQEVEGSLTKKINEVQCRNARETGSSNHRSLRALRNVQANLCQHEVLSTPNLGMPQTGIHELRGTIGFTQKQPTRAQNYYSTRISKIEFHKFIGLRVKEWLYRCKQFFSLNKTPHESKVI